MNLKAYYLQRKEKAETALGTVRNKIRKISVLRVILFISGAICLFHLYPYGLWISIGILACTLIPFLVLVKYHNRLFLKKEWWETSIIHYQNELAAQDGDSSSFEDGKEHTNPEHPYTFDLDIFGKRSLFQTINRTCTPFGKNTLAEWMKNHLTNHEPIRMRQEAIRELAGLKDFRENFRITGMLFKGKETDMESIGEWVRTPGYFSKRKWCQWIVPAVPCVNLFLLILGLSGIISMNWVGISFGCFLVASFGLVRRVTLIQSNYEKRLEALSTYTRLIRLIEEQELKSRLLLEWKEYFKSNGLQAREILNLLEKELDRLNLRNNQLLYVILEGSLFWQLRQMLRIEHWKQTYGQQLMIWLDTLGKMDAICSLGTFAFNHQEYTYPQIAEKPFTFKARDMGHPLMPSSQCVRNDASIPSRPYFIIITGANMAGKSTYLRTIGSNYLLAAIGAPVCCSSLEVYPAQLMTSLRTSDSLNNNESYFFAELKRLKRIIGQLNDGKEMFIILDEILKGTNSKDKQKGSFALVQQLMELKTNGILATHDLLLGELAGRFPNEVKNYCFEADIQNNELTFSYKLKEGIAQNMNACFLMRKMGIIINS